MLIFGWLPTDEYPYRSLLLIAFLVVLVLIKWAILLDMTSFVGLVSSLYF